MNKYTDLVGKHSKMINDFPMTFAFSNKQFEEAKEKMGVTNNEELVSIGSGGIIRKTDTNSYHAMLKTLDQESEEAMKDDDYLYEGFLYELGNHEYCITYDPTDTFECFGLTVDEVQSNERLWALFEKAKNQYLAGVIW